MTDKIKTASTTQANAKFYRLLALGDWVLAVICLVVGIWQVAASWPSPAWWAWLSLAFGVVGIPVAALNPAKRLNKLVMRKVVKRR